MIIAFLHISFIFEGSYPALLGWVSKFISFMNGNPDISKDSVLLSFLEQLPKKKKFEDWQLQQAEEAVKLYQGHFLKAEKHGDNASSCTVLDFFFRDVSGHHGTDFLKMPSAYRSKRESWRSLLISYATMPDSINRNSYRQSQAPRKISLSDMIGLPLPSQ
jgi:hypothetical protein